MNQRNIRLLRVDYVVGLFIVLYGLNDHIGLNNTQKTATAIKCNGGRDEKD